MPSKIESMRGQIEPNIGKLKKTQNSILGGEDLISHLN